MEIEIPVSTANTPASVRDDSPRRVGLARALSKLGYCSRSRAAELIRAGKVRLNGVVRRDPEAPVQVNRDRIEVDGQPVAIATKIYLMMNKPRGLVTTASDERRRETIYDLLKSADMNLPWVAPIGRLDKASEGLLLLTNDSEWGARLAAPETHLDKTYHVQVGRVVNEADLVKIVGGLSINGERLRAKHIHLVRSGQKNCWLEIVLDEGKNRHIRRMLNAIHLDVLRLVRIAIGSLQLGDLPKGTVRSLTMNEKDSLDCAMKASAARKRSR